MTIVSTRGGTLEDLLKKIEEFVGKQAEGDKKAKAAEFIKQAKEVLGSKDPDLRKVLELLGKLIELFKDKMPEELKGVMEAYGQAVQSCIDLLNVTPGSPFERAVKKAYEETGSIDEAIKLALKLFPETTAAEVDAARNLLENIIKARELKGLKDSHPAPKSGWKKFWDWAKSLIAVSRPEQVIAPVLVLTATLALGVGLLGDRGLRSVARIDAAPLAEGAAHHAEGGLPSTEPMGRISLRPASVEGVKPSPRHPAASTSAVISSRDLPRICGTPGCDPRQPGSPTVSPPAPASGTVLLPLPPVQVPLQLQPIPSTSPTHK